MGLQVLEKFLESHNLMRPSSAPVAITWGSKVGVIELISNPSSNNSGIEPFVSIVWALLFWLNTSSLSRSNFISFPNFIPHQTSFSKCGEIPKLNTIFFFNKTQLGSYDYSSSLFSQSRLTSLCATFLCWSYFEFWFKLFKSVIN